MCDAPPPSIRSGRALLSPAQIRGARGMLDWSMADLARSARLSVSTIKRMEMAATQPISDSAFTAVRNAMEAAGLHFLFGSGGCEGICIDGPRGGPAAALAAELTGSPRRDDV